MILFTHYKNNKKNNKFNKNLSQNQVNKKVKINLHKVFIVVLDKLIYGLVLHLLDY
jgi:hypothetical protein